jgi:hypothetical protein
VLDNTLHIDKDDEEEELQEVKVTEETPRLPKSSSMPSIIDFEFLTSHRIHLKYFYLLKLIITGKGLIVFPGL